MPKPTKGPRLGGGPAHERLMLANLAAALFTHKSIKTTETKAKRLRPLAERLITFAKRGDLHARRRVLAIIDDKAVVHELFTEIAPLVAEREGGYTRITKLGFRKGDNAPMAQIELVLEPVAPKVKSTKSTHRGRREGRAGRGGPGRGGAGRGDRRRRGFGRDRGRRGRGRRGRHRRRRRLGGDHRRGGGREGLVLSQFQKAPHPARMRGFLLCRGVALRDAARSSRSDRAADGRRFPRLGG